MIPTFALGVPSTPWIPERVASLARLLDALQPEANAHEFRLFTDREPNCVWSQKLWRWAASTSATHLLQLQDDIIPAPNFWPALRAMVAAVPDQVIGLETVHPICRELARLGKRWARTRAWLVGPQYVFPLSGPNSLATFLAWCDANPQIVEKSIGEDVTVSTWIASTGRDVHHPMPAIADHDLTVASVYHNDHHDHRKPVVTWHAYGPEIEDPKWWAPPAEVPLLPGAGWPKCYFCLQEDGKIVSQATGAMVGPNCLAKMLEVMINRLQSAPTPGVMRAPPRGSPP